jgi:hypothetical protein
MKGYVFVASEGLAEDEDLRSWVEACCTLAGNMPMKVPKAKPTPKAKSAKVASMKSQGGER